MFKLIVSIVVAILVPLSIFIWAIASLPQYVSTPSVATASEPTPSLPPCAMEDSDNCVWNAQTQGNGIGTSFVTLDGVTYYAEPTTPPVVTEYVDRVEYIDRVVAQTEYVTEYVDRVEYIETIVTVHDNVTTTETTPTVTVTPTPDVAPIAPVVAPETAPVSAPAPTERPTEECPTGYAYAEDFTCVPLTFWDDMATTEPLPETPTESPVAPTE